VRIGIVAEVVMGVKAIFYTGTMMEIAVSGNDKPMCSRLRKAKVMI